MKRAAIYRILYGEDFIEQSINSVLDAVDDVYVFWTQRVWGDCKSVRYKRKEIKFPVPIDSVLDIVLDMPRDDEASLMPNKVHLINHYYPTPRNQFTELANHHVNADIVLLIEADQVMRDAVGAFEEFESSTMQVAACRQIEYWKTKAYRIPERPRPGPIFWRTPLPDTQINGAPKKGEMPRLEHVMAENYGFCMSDRAMYWKHLTALAFSKIIADSQPREDWYDEVWLKWTPEMEDLEIAINGAHLIKKAIPTGEHA